MAIALHITDARIWQAEGDPQWRVSHPSNGAILATCDTRAEAEMVREFLNDLPRQMRDPQIGTLHTGAPVTVEGA